MNDTDTSRAQRSSPLSPASGGAGPLLQRDYWGVIEGCRLSPEEVLRVVAAQFWAFAPPELVRFSRADGHSAPLEAGDELDVRIRGAPKTGVRVIHKDAQTITIATLRGHPEAGRITFGAYRNRRGEVIFHIRSRARSGSLAHLAGFRALGEAMQTQTWGDFINRVAATVGSRIRGYITAETRTIREEDPSTLDGPTFWARGN